MAKRKSLVTQHLENLSREVLKDYKDIIREYVKRRHGVYSLYRKNRLYYVGLASNLRSRLNSHLRDRHADTWDRFSIYLTVGDEHLRELESLVMRISSPKGNKQRGKFARSEDLRRRFRRQVAQYQRVELNRLFGFTRAKEAEKLKKRITTDGRIPTLAKYVTKRFRIHFDTRANNIVRGCAQTERLTIVEKSLTHPLWPVKLLLNGRQTVGTLGSINVLPATGCD
jgi:hypothetical protein